MAGLEPTEEESVGGGPRSADQLSGKRADKQRCGRVEACACTEPAPALVLHNKVQNALRGADRADNN